MSLLFDQRPLRFVRASFPRLLVLAIFCSFSCGLSCSFAADSPPQPNFVFILADDLRWNTLGCMGDPLVQTPRIDALAARGALFRNHFVTTSICCVSRASILTGQHERRHGIADFTTAFTDAQWSQTYPALLRAAGYRTAFIGKFGVGDEKAIAAKAGAFDFWRGLPSQAGTFFIDPEDPSKTHTTARFGDQALEFLAGCTATQPFCLSISLNAPHARDAQPREFQPDLRDETLYASDKIPPPSAANSAFFARLPEFVQKSEGRRRWERRFATAEMSQATMRDYYRLVTGIDREVGRIVEALAQRGLTENTVVIFTSDNGWLAGDRGLADKWLMYDESIRVPLIVCDPRSSAQHGRSIDALTLNIDFAPTLLALAGTPVPRSMQGRSLAPLLAGERPPEWRTDFFYEHHFDPKIIPPSEGIRTERWCYIHWLPPNPESDELYDLAADPDEARNLAIDPTYATTLAELRTRWEHSREQLK
jgi:arylsulfatase A-like enzyme